MYGRPIYIYIYNDGSISTTVVSQLEVVSRGEQSAEKTRQPVAVAGSRTRAEIWQCISLPSRKQEEGL